MPAQYLGLPEDEIRLAQADTDDAVAALRKIAAAKARFVSRGDMSGTDAAAAVKGRFRTPQRPLSLGGGNRS
jgi:hypothetical protein